MRNPTEDCATCRFFFPKDEGSGGSGDCRRHAPAVTTFTETNGLGEQFHMPLTSWPQVGEAEWCGDFEAPPEETPAEPVLIAPSCEHCKDGIWFVLDPTPDGKCPKCGADCIPF